MVGIESFTVESITVDDQVRSNRLRLAFYSCKTAGISPVGQAKTGPLFSST